MFAKYYLSKAFLDVTASNEDIELDEEVCIFLDRDGGKLFKEFNVPILFENMFSFLFRDDECILKSLFSFFDPNFAAPPTFLTSNAAESTNVEGPSVRTIYNDNCKRI